MAVIKKEAYFLSSTGEDKVFCTIWLDSEQQPRGIFQIAHGVAEHIGRYDEFARFMASMGFVVCGNDHLGHGRTAEANGEFGFFAEENGDVRLVDDMHILSLIMKKRYPELPLFLFGHSMGSFCARVYASSFGNELAGLILCGTGELPSAAVALEPMLGLLCEKLGAKADVPNDLFDKVSCLGIKDKRTVKDWLSASETNVDSFINDPLCGVPMKLGAVRDIVSLANSACANVWPLTVPTGLPILIISGAKDPIGFSGRGVIAVSDNLEDAGHKPHVIMYPGSRHEILNEDNRQKVFEDILQWIDESCFMQMA